MRGDKDFSKKVFARGGAITTFTLKQLRTRIGGCGGEHDCHLISPIYMKDYRPKLSQAYQVILVEFGREIHKHMSAVSDSRSLSIPQAW